MSDTDEDGSNFINKAVGAFIFIGLLAFFWPSLIAPFRFFEFWTIKGSLYDAVIGAWPLYLWGVGATTFLTLKAGLRWRQDPGEIIFEGALLSIAAGVLEEISFRWLIFFAAMVMLPIMDWLLLGFMGLHWIKWVYVVVLCPIANLFTLGYLQHYLLNGYGWAVAAAIVSVNSEFRDAHNYLGRLGLINAWFLGMYFFWVMFTYGIIAAIIIHFLYDFFIFVVQAIDAALARRRRWT